MELIKDNRKRPKQTNKGPKIKNTRQNKKKRSSSDIARRKLQRKRYEEQSEEKQDSNSVYSDAAESEVRAVKHVALYAKDKLKRPKTRKRTRTPKGTSLDTDGVPETTPHPDLDFGKEPKTIQQQKGKLAVEELEKKKSQQVETGKKKLQIKQTVGTQKRKQLSIQREQALQGNLQKKSSLNPTQSSNRSSSIFSSGGGERENPLVRKKKNQIPKKRERYWKQKSKGKGNFPKTKERLGLEFPFSKGEKLGRRKAKNKSQQRLRHKMMEVAKKTAKTTTKAAKRAASVATKTAKALISGFGIFLGGPAVIGVMVLVAVVSAMISSPFGIFFSGEDTTTEVKPIASVVQNINEEFDQEIQDIIQNNPADETVIHYEGSNDGVRINNWVDVITIFSIETTMGSGEQMDVVTIDTKREDLIRKMFHQMNLVDFEIEIEKLSEDPDDDDTKSILHIYVTSKSAWDLADELNFDADKREIMEEMMGGELRLELLKLLGVTYEGLTPEEIEAILESLPEGDLGAMAVQEAVARLGDPYSIPKRGQGRYTDCSHLTMWSYEQLGVTIPPTAATQAQFLYDNNMTVSQSELRPGDFVFWSYGPSSGEFMDIGHCGFYIGGGNVIHASSVDMQVVIEPLFHQDKIVFFARLSNE